MQHPRYSLDGEASTYSTLPIVFPIALALALFIQLKGEIMELNPKRASIKLSVIHKFRGAWLVKAYQVFVKSPKSLRENFLHIDFLGEQ